MQFGVTSQVVRLYIDDQRNIGTIAKSSVEVTLTVADTHDCGPREWRVEAQDLLPATEEQCRNFGFVSMSSIRVLLISCSIGAVKVSYPDPVFPDYCVSFVKMTGDVPLEMLRPNPRMLVIGEQNILHLFVNAVSYKLLVEE